MSVDQVAARALADPLLRSREESDLAVTVRNVGKMYHIYDRPQDRLKQLILARFGRTYGQEFWGLRDVSLDVRKGERFGVIGRNGSGKSTLLQIIAGTLAPTTGEVHVNGRVAALLELGSGFNPDFTGRQNVYMNGSILGLSRKEIEGRFDQIAAFADIGDFIDQPVKIYSSGMFVRLAFAVATSVDADILLIDEALAVGDVFFTQKCYRRLTSLIASGVAVVLVTHDMAAISQFCNTAMVLDLGRCVYLGNPVHALRKYFSFQREGVSSAIQRLRPEKPGERKSRHQADTESFIWPSHESFLSLEGALMEGLGLARCNGVALCNPDGAPCQIFRIGERAYFYYEFLVTEDIEVPIGGVTIVNEKNVIVHGKNSLQYGTPAPSEVRKGTTLRFRQSIVLDVQPGNYSFLVGLATLNPIDYQNADYMSYPALAEKITRVLSVGQAGSFTVTFRNEGHALPHHGLCNLPGECSLMLSNDEV